VSNDTRQRDRWQDMSDSEVLDDVATWGLDRQHECFDEMSARLREIARAVERIAPHSGERLPSW